MAGAARACTHLAAMHGAGRGRTTLPRTQRLLLYLKHQDEKAFRSYAIQCTPFMSARTFSMVNTRRWMATTTTTATAETTSEPAQVASSSSSGPLSVYTDLIAQGSLKESDFQRTIIETLQEMHDRLMTYTPEPIVPGSSNASGKERGLFSKLSSFFNNEEDERPAKEPKVTRKAEIPKGLYLYGNVGTGKTMLMDLFYNTLPRSDKTRIHFHNFMLQLHGRLHKLKTTTHPHSDPIPFLADSLATESRVFCLDEFQVTDIADAMLLRRLLEELVVRRGVVLVTTSNRHPTELYKNGIQRESFLPCITILEENCVVKCLDGGIDYRREKKTFFQSAKPVDKNKLASGVSSSSSSSSDMPKVVKSKSEARVPSKLVDEKRFFWPLGPDTVKDVEKYFDTIRNGNPVREKRIRFLGRELVLPRTAGYIAMCSFDDLCAKSLSAADYLRLAESVDTLILTDIPKLKPTTLHRNETRRLITLIDALYEYQVKLVCSADGPISEIFGGGSGVHSTDEDPSAMGQLTPAQRQMMDDLGLNDVSQVKKSPIFSGEEEKFAVQRAESRLIEMQGPGWGL